MQNVVYARIRDPEKMRFIYHQMAETDQSMREIIECMVTFCMKSKTFVVPTKPVPLIERRLLAISKRTAHYRKLASK